MTEDQLSQIADDVIPAELFKEDNQEELNVDTSIIRLRAITGLIIEALVELHPNRKRAKIHDYSTNLDFYGFEFLGVRIEDFMVEPLKQIFERKGWAIIDIECSYNRGTIMSYVTIFPRDLVIERKLEHDPE